MYHRPDGALTNLDAILNELEPALAQALLDAFAGIRRNVDMPALRDAVERGDVQAVEDALNIEESSFAPYAAVATTLFVTFGLAYAPTIRISPLTVPPLTGLAAGLTPEPPRSRNERRRERRLSRHKFNIPAAMPAGQSVIQENVRRITEQARQIAREMVVEGVGRRDVAKRIRDSIGLSHAQHGYVESMRRRLASGDPVEMRAVLSGQSLRDKRFDRTIKKAIAAGQPLSPGQIEKMTEAYTRKLIRKRAQEVAAAESQQVAEAAKFEAVKQTGRPVTKEWRHSQILRFARKDHIFMNKRKVEGLETPFVMPDGVQMQYAHDPSGGAKHNANCRCRTVYSVGELP